MHRPRAGEGVLPALQEEDLRVGVHSVLSPLHRNPPSVWGMVNVCHLVAFAPLCCVRLQPHTRRKPGEKQS